MAVMEFQYPTSLGFESHKYTIDECCLLALSLTMVILKCKIKTRKSLSTRHMTATHTVGSSKKTGIKTKNTDPEGIGCSTEMETSLK
jgi:hypothetical protein